MTNATGEVNEYLVQSVAKTDLFFGNDRKEIVKLRQDKVELREEYAKLHEEYAKLRQYAVDLANNFNNLLKDYNISQATVQKLHADLIAKQKELTEKQQTLNEQQQELTEARENYDATRKTTKILNDKIIKLTEGGDLLLDFLKDHVRDFGYRDFGIKNTIYKLVEKAETLIHPKPVTR